MLRMNVCFCCVRFSFFSTSQEIGLEKCLRNDLLRYWHVVCLQQGAIDFVYGPADATGTPSSLASLKSARLTFLVPAFTDCPGKKAIKQVSVYLGRKTETQLLPASRIRMRGIKNWLTIIYHV